MESFKLENQFPTFVLKFPMFSLKEEPRLLNQELTLVLKVSIVVLQEEKKVESLSVIKVMPDVRSSKRTLSLSAIRSGILRIESIREESSESPPSLPSGSGVGELEGVMENPEKKDHH